MVAPLRKTLAQRLGEGSFRARFRWLLDEDELPGECPFPESRAAAAWAQIHLYQEIYRLITPNPETERARRFVAELVVSESEKLAPARRRARAKRA